MHIASHEAGAFIQYNGYGEDFESDSRVMSSPCVVQPTSSLAGAVWGWMVGMCGSLTAGVLCRRKERDTVCIGLRRHFLLPFIKEPFCEYFKLCHTDRHMDCADPLLSLLSPLLYCVHSTTVVTTTFMK